MALTFSRRIVEGNVPGYKALSNVLVMEEEIGLDKVMMWSANGEKH